MNLFEDNGAHFSEDRKYRYALWRIWDREKPLIMFIGLNPSNADEIESDPTIRRVGDFANKWGFGGFYMMNLFSFVTPYPEQLQAPEANDDENDTWLYNISKTCKTIIYCWGNFPQAKGRAMQILERFPGGFAIIINKNGSPRHPLYIKRSCQPVKYPPI